MSQLTFDDLISPCAANPQSTVADRLTVPDGYYTVVTQGFHRTFRLKTVKNAPMKGARIVSYLRGKNNEKHYTAFAFLRGNGNVAVWKRYRNTPGILHLAKLFESATFYPNEAGQLYALKSGNCCRCGRLLTHPESIADGIGPECKKNALK